MSIRALNFQLRHFFHTKLSEDEKQKQKNIEGTQFFTKDYGSLKCFTKFAGNWSVSFYLAINDNKNMKNRCNYLNDHLFQVNRCHFIDANTAYDSTGAWNRRESFSCVFGLGDSEGG